MSQSSLSQLISVVIDEYGEDATRLAVNAAGSFDAVTDLDVARWRRVVDQLWSMRAMIAYKPTEVETPKTPKRVVLLHGRNSDPSEHFFPWVKSALLGHGFEVLSPVVADRGQGEWQDWKNALDGVADTLDKDTTVIAFSLGALAICRFLSDNPDIQLAGMHLVGGVFDDFIRPFQPDDLTRQVRSFDPAGIDRTGIGQRVGRIHIHHSTDDEKVDFASAERYMQAFSVATLHSYSNKNHFLNQIEFSELVSQIVMDSQPDKRLIILDFDGVLADTWEVVYATRMTVNRMTKAEAIEYERSLLTRPYHSKRMPDLQSKLAEREKWQKQYRKNFAALRPALFTEFVEVLKAIPDARFAIVSNSEKQLIEKVVQDSGLEIDTILNYKHHHSKVEKVEKVCRMWGTSPHKVWYVTDTQADVVELRELIPVSHILGCSWGYHGSAALLEVLPDANVLMRAQDIFAAFKLEPEFVVSPAAQGAFRVVQELIHDDEAPALVRLNAIKKCIAQWTQLTFVPHQMWAELLMAIAPFAPVIAQELWSQIPDQFRTVDSVHETV